MKSTARLTPMRGVWALTTSSAETSDCRLGVASRRSGSNPCKPTMKSVGGAWLMTGPAWLTGTQVVGHVRRAGLRPLDDLRDALEARDAVRVAGVRNASPG
ncbi:MAG: hypothetical protein IPG44_17475 [Anaerolineales bacterium]|nr:hypothetical protein [Anaerolineales bacterium]